MSKNEPDIRQQLKDIYNESRRMAMLRTNSPIDYMVESVEALISQTVSSVIEAGRVDGMFIEWNGLNLADIKLMDEELQRLLGREV